MARGIEWARFEHEWRRTLRSFGLESFHHRDLRKKRLSYRSTSRRAVALWDSLLYVIESHKLFGVATAVLADDYRTCARLYRDTHPDFLPKQAEHPYYFAFQYVLVEAVRRARLRPPEHLVFVFDRQTVYEKLSRQIHADLQSHPSWEHSSLLGTMDSRSTAESYPLQAADLFVSTLCRDLERHLEDPLLPEHPIVARLKRRSMHLQYHTQESIASRFSEALSLPLNANGTGA